MFQVERNDTPVTQTEFQIFRRFSWFRVAFGIAAAVLVTLIIVGATVRDTAVTGCYRAATVHDAEADNWEVASKIRAKDGDNVVARRYYMNALEIRAQIFMPRDWIGKLNQRGRSRHLREVGCRQAYPPLLPFIG
jgi:hypothetical protein